MGNIFPYNSRKTDVNSILSRRPTYSGVQYYGKYRGVVTNNNDSDGMGRLKLKVPSVLGNNESDWALPCISPFAGDNTGFMWIPEVGDIVWVEFENGDPSFPIWVGGFFAQNKTPDDTSNRGKKNNHLQHIVKTPKGLMINLDDGSDGTTSFIDIKDPNGNSIRVDHTNNKIIITAQNSTKVTVDGDSGNVSVNGGSKQVARKGDSVSVSGTTSDGASFTATGTITEGSSILLTD